MKCASYDRRCAASERMVVQDPGQSAVPQDPGAVGGERLRLLARDALSAQRYRLVTGDGGLEPARAGQARRHLAGATSVPQA